MDLAGPERGQPGVLLGQDLEGHPVQVREGLVPVVRVPGVDDPVLGHVFHQLEGAGADGLDLEVLPLGQPLGDDPGGPHPGERAQRG